MANGINIPKLPKLELVPTKTSYSSTNVGTPQQRANIIGDVSRSGEEFQQTQALTAGQKINQITNLQQMREAAMDEADAITQQYMDMTQADINALTGFQPKPTKLPKAPGGPEQGAEQAQAEALVGSVRMGPPTEAEQEKFFGAPERPESGINQEELNQILGPEPKVPGAIELLQGKLKTSNEALAQTQEAVKNFKINPYKDIGVMQTIGMAIAAGLGAFAQGYSGGRVPNTALQIINTALDRKASVQKQQYQKMLMDLNATKKQRNYLQNQMDKLLGQKKEATLRLAQLQTAQLANQDKRLQSRIGAAEMINKIQEEINKTRYDMQMKTVETKQQLLGKSTATSTRGVDPLMLEAVKAQGKKKADKPPAAVENKFAEGLNVLNKVQDLEDTYVRLNPWKYTGPVSKAKQEYEAKLADYIENETVRVTGAAATETQVENFTKQVGSGRNPIPFIGEKPEIAKKKFENKRKALLSELRTYANKYPGLIKYMTPEQQEMLGTLGTPTGGNQTKINFRPR